MEASLASVFFLREMNGVLDYDPNPSGTPPIEVAPPTGTPSELKAELASLIGKRKLSQHEKLAKRFAEVARSAKLAGVNFVGRDTMTPEEAVAIIVSGRVLENPTSKYHGLTFGVPGVPIKEQLAVAKHLKVADGALRFIHSP